MRGVTTLAREIDPAEQMQVELLLHRDGGEGVGTHVIHTSAPWYSL